MWIINFDETEHKMGTKAKGNIQVQQYHNLLFPWAGDQIVEIKKHITVVYCANPLEVLPPLFIFDTKAKSGSNFIIGPAWSHGLPKVSGKIRTGAKQILESLIVMKPKGGMDATMFPIFICHIILPYYPYIQQETVCDHVCKKGNGGTTHHQNRQRGQGSFPRDLSMSNSMKSS